jgi:hypothetical protein
MKSSINLVGLIFLILATILHSCVKHEVPILTTSEVTNITGTTATSGGTITDEGSGSVIAHGVCWSTTPDPTILLNKTSDGAGAGTFVSFISDLNEVTKYYVRAYATNNAGTGYGMTMSFLTLGQAPTASTGSATNITSTSAELNGNVNANWLNTGVSFEYGTTTSYGQFADAGYGEPIIGNVLTNVSAEIEDLIPFTTYHFRVGATNLLGTTYGNDMSFTTLGQSPTATTQSACCLSSTGAKLNGTVNANYVSTTVTFEYGLTTSYGNSIAATPSLVTGNSSTNVSASISALNSGTTYHFRIKAINSLGTTYGSDATLTTL